MKIWKLVRVGVLAVAVAALGGVTARAQQWSVYGLGTVGNLRAQNTGYTYGGAFGVAREKQGTPLLAWALDARVTLTDGGNVNGQYTDRRLDTGTFGFRVTATPRSRFKPYLEGALGYGYWRGGEGLTRQDQYTSVLQGMGGLDFRIKRNIDWRVAEISYSRLSGQIHFINPITVSTGIVIRVP